MAFEHKEFTDGERNYNTPEWRRTIETIQADVSAFSYGNETRKRKLVQENEVGLKHPTNGSYIRIKDDGAIELFSGYGTGLRVNTNQSLQFFGDTIQFIGRESRFHTSANGLNVNDKALGGEYPSLAKKGLTASFLDLMDNEKGGAR